ncbi:hypothetical protein ES319_D13G054100v1 [Gossypium barbadense]|uniref:SCP domain-containing protein n=2 Tax=Gossypium TaxID=3633 RepID=A0A5J5NIF1_GOSBA|nr:hypothetical protein ES319_D13G054100v1 [Gossypium barbadense]TYG36334.1 hypothetical protein ES288_D13G056500v1 [Gossypium darwinii]
MASFGYHMELCKISVAFSLVVLALFSRIGTHGSIGATQPGSTQSKVTVAAAPNPASIKNGSSPQDFWHVHNAARAVVGVCPIIWNNVVARYAANYAEKRISDCDLVHSGRPYGENLAWSNGYLSGPDAVRLWIDEKDYYNLKSGVCDSSHVCSRLGCAKVIGSNNGGTFVICNYDHPSNDPIGKNQSNIMVATVPNPSFAAEGSLPQDYLNVHNMACAAVGVRPITSDNMVAMSAANYANKRILNCELMPSKGPYVIWRNSVNLGCAKAKCNNGGTFIVCNYDPLGKIVGKFFSRTKRHKDDINIDNHHHISDVFFSGGEFRYGMALRKFSLVELAKFMANSNLDSHLFKGKSLLNWEVRYKIVQDLASALFYLHEEGDHYYKND